MRMIFGGQTDEYDFHYFGWNYAIMERFILNAGFIKCEKVKGFSLLIIKAIMNLMVFL